MAPTYTQIKMTMACLGGKPKVRPVSRATPIVAVRPGSIPMTMPMKVLAATYRRVRGVSRFQSSTRMYHGPRSMPASRQRDGKDPVEDVGDGGGRSGGDQEDLPPRPGPEHEHDRDQVPARGEPVRDIAAQQEAVE